MTRPLQPYRARSWYPAHFRRSGKPGERFKAQRIVNKLRQADVELARENTESTVCKLLGITDATYFRWPKEYGGLTVDQAKCLKALERENARLKRLLADAEFDKAILRAAAKGDFRARYAAGLRRRKSDARRPRLERAQHAACSDSPGRCSGTQRVCGTTTHR